MWIKNSKKGIKIPVMNRLTTNSCRNIGAGKEYDGAGFTFISVKMVVLNGFTAIPSTDSVVKWACGRVL
ncbi:hypothetical protein [Bartonella harrusi]|uniref:Uncharacterized protein n=1 Tax=Bartonella harrusi TaxID=2961895 RepID=A0ABY5ESM4_9HYPH|nr:hypothetical protein [Bartonella harrusi]UTO28282.1 hypothetical protein NMK50_09120 [Bartonella harrusi]